MNGEYKQDGCVCFASVAGVCDMTEWRHAVCGGSNANMRTRVMGMKIRRLCWRARWLEYLLFLALTKR